MSKEDENGPGLAGLGSFLRSTWEQLGAVRTVVEYQARSQRKRIDELLSQREHRQLLAEIGDLVCDMISQGQLDVSQYPELSKLYDEIHRRERDMVGSEGIDRQAAAPVEVADDDSSSFDEWGRPLPPDRVGVDFVDDDPADSDLGDYMHKDDVPE